MTWFEIGICSGMMYFTNKFFFDLYTEIRDYHQEEIKSINKRKLAFSILIIIGITILNQLFSANNKAMILGLEIGLLFTIFVGVLGLLVKLIFWLSSLRRTRHKTISSINNRGFDFINGKRIKQFYWNEIESAVITSDLSQLILKGKQNVILEKKYGNYYSLLKKVPRGLIDLNYELIDSFFANLKTCNICGTIAVSENECLSCGCYGQNTELPKEFSSYEEYVKANQLEVFATMERNEKFSDFKILDKNFDFDETWTPIVSKKEVLDYSKKEYWTKE